MGIPAGTAALAAGPAAAAGGPSTGALLGAAGIMGGMNALSTGITSAFNIHESRQNRRFQRNMANTEMQRRVRDLRAAGINPMLAVGGHGLGGASVPHSAAGVAEAPRMDPTLGIQVMQAAAGIEETKARTAKELADAGKISAETSFLNASMEDRLNMIWTQLQHEMQKKDLTQAEEEKIVTQILEVEKHMELMDLQKKHSALDLDRMRAESDMYKFLGGFGAAGKAGLLRIPFPALRRARALGNIGNKARGGIRVGVDKAGNIKRVNLKTGEVLD